MDRIIVDKRLIKPKQYKFIALGLFLILVASYFTFRDRSETFRVKKNTLTIEEVFYGEFNDYMRIIGVVEPISTVYLDAVEGGIVEELLIEEGSMVRKGDVILELSNTNLNLSILNSEAQLAEKANFLRETQLSMQQQKLTLQRELLNYKYQLRQKERTYTRNKMLFEEGFISKEEFLLSEEDYAITQDIYELTLERNRQDSIFRKNQVEKISINLVNMQKNLELIYKRQDNLKIRALVDGQLGLLDAELGQSVNAGQRMGQINVLTSYKVKAQLDEHYIDRVRKGLSATLHRQTDTFRLAVHKVYPEVRDGRFEIDLVFEAGQPDNIRTGQSYHISLQLGKTQDAIQVARGGFYQSTGGQWAFVLSPDGHTATRRNIEIGKQNPKSYEIVDGLEVGEKIVVSAYDSFLDNEKLILTD